MTIYFEDFTAGSVIELGSVVMTEDEIIEFATKYDPQPFHTDPVAAAESPFGRLVASGWHTALMGVRLMIKAMADDGASHGSPGVDKMRWLFPVYPGDTVSARCRITSTRESASRPDRGYLGLTIEMENQDGVMVLTFDSVAMYGRRPT